MIRVFNYINSKNQLIIKEILITEDNDEIRENTAEILRLVDYDVTMAKNGAD